MPVLRTNRRGGIACIPRMCSTVQNNYFPCGSSSAAGTRQRIDRQKHRQDRKEEKQTGSGHAYGNLGLFVQFQDASHNADGPSTHPEIKVKHGRSSPLQVKELPRRPGRGRWIPGPLSSCRRWLGCGSRSSKHPPANHRSGHPLLSGPSSVAHSRSGTN